MHNSAEGPPTLNQKAGHPILPHCYTKEQGIFSCTFSSPQYRLSKGLAFSFKVENSCGSTRSWKRTQRCTAFITFIRRNVRNMPFFICINNSTFGSLLIGILTTSFIQDYLYLSEWKSSLFAAFFAFSISSQELKAFQVSHGESQRETYLQPIFLYRIHEISNARNLY